MNKRSGDQFVLMLMLETVVEVRNDRQPELQMINAEYFQVFHASGRPSWWHVVGFWNITKL